MDSWTCQIKKKKKDTKRKKRKEKKVSEIGDGITFNFEFDSNWCCLSWHFNNRINRIIIATSFPVLTFCLYVLVKTFQDNMNKARVMFNKYCVRVKKIP